MRFAGVVMMRLCLFVDRLVCKAHSAEQERGSKGRNSLQYQCMVREKESPRVVGEVVLKTCSSCLGLLQEVCGPLSGRSYRQRRHDNTEILGHIQASFRRPGSGPADAVPEITDQFRLLIIWFMRKLSFPRLSDKTITMATEQDVEFPCSLYVYLNLSSRAY
jgi:hypothetical protein